MGLSIASAAHILGHFKRSKNNIESLLCMRKSIYYQSEMISRVNSYNKVILINYPLQKSSIPYISQAAKVLILALKSKQQFEYYRYKNKVLNLRECAKACKAMLITFKPYKTNSIGVLKRNFNGSVYLTKRTFKSRYFKSLKFLYMSKIEIKSKYDTKPKVTFFEDKLSKIFF
jgi:hypothetical protein